MNGSEIKLVRMKKGLTMKEFGELFEPPASDSIVSRWERNVSRPSPKRMKKIMELKEGSNSNEKLSIGEEIKRLRKERNLTQQELANISGLSRSYLGDVENNRNNPSIRTVETLAIKMGYELKITFNQLPSI